MRARAVLLGALSEVVLVVAMLLTGRLLTGTAGSLLLPVGLVLGATAAGFLMVRSLGARWPEPVGASVVAGIVLLLVVTLAMPWASPLIVGQYPGASRDQALGAALFIAAGGAGMFALPLTEPRVRKAGTAPAPVRVAATAVGLLALAATVLLLWTRGTGPGLPYVVLGVLAIGGVGGLLAVGLGMGLTLLKLVRTGAWVGSLGLLTGLLSLAVWLAAGRPWFP